MDETQLYEATKKAAAHFNDTQADEEMIVGQLLEGDDAVNFLRYLMSASEHVQAGKISADQALQGTKEWIVPEDDTSSH
jgi:nucleoside diphosphate kinase